MGAPPADHPTDRQVASATTGAIPPRKSRAFRLGLVLGWFFLLAYIAWLAHNALPWLTGATPLPSPLPALITQLLTLPSLPALSATPLATPALASTVAALMLALLVILPPLTFLPLPAAPSPAAPASLASAAAPRTPTPAPTTVQEPPAPPLPVATTEAHATAHSPLPVGEGPGVRSAGPQVFISHASADNPFGKPLVERLRADLGGIDAVWYDSLGEPENTANPAHPIGWHGGIHPASYWELDIFRQLRERPVFVVLLSPAALDSDWVQDEILLAWKQKNERGRAHPKVIVPVLLPDARDLTIPEPLSIIQAVSFIPQPDWTPRQAEEAEQAAYQALLVAIRAAKTQLRPGEPEPPFDLTALEVPTPFVGREHELDWLLDRLTPGATSAITALRGLGGIGKSGLAAMAIQRVFEDGRFPSGIVVQDCRDLSDPVAVLKGVLASFDLDHHAPETSDLKALAELAHKLLRGRKILIVLDNVEPELDITAVLQRLQPTGAALLLTARDTLPLPHDATLLLEVLTPVAALDLFAEWYSGGDAAMLSPTDRALATRIVAALGRHTLAVKLAGAEARDLDRPLATFTQEVEAHPLNIQDQGPNVTLAVKETLMRSVTKLPTTGDLGDVRRLFAALATFQAPVFAQTSTTLTTATTATGAPTMQLVPVLDIGRQAAIAIAEGLGLPAPDRAVDLLTRRALLDKTTDPNMPEESDRERLRLHPLLRELAAELLDEPTRQTASLALAVFYANYFDATPRSALAADAGAIAGALEWAHAAPPTALPAEDRAALVAALCSGMGQFWRDRSRTRESLRYLPWGTAAAEATLGDPPSVSASTENRDAWERRADRLLWLQLNLGYAYYITGQLNAAQTHYEGCLTLARAASNRRDVGVALSVLGQVAQARGRLDEAADYFQQSLAIHREVQNRQGEGVVLSTLGQVAQARGRLDEAETYFQQSLAIRREVSDRRGEGVVLSNLGQVAQPRGRLDEAADYFQQSLAIRREVRTARARAWSSPTWARWRSSAGASTRPPTTSSRASPSAVRSATARARAWSSPTWARWRSARAPRRGRRLLPAEPRHPSVRFRTARARAWSSPTWARWRRRAGASTRPPTTSSRASPSDREVSDRQGEGVVLSNLGQVAQARGRLDEAADYFQQSLAIRP